MKQISEELVKKIDSSLIDLLSGSPYELKPDDVFVMIRDLRKLPDTFYTQAIKHREKLNFSTDITDLMEKLSEESAEAKYECDNYTNMKKLLYEIIDFEIVAADIKRFAIEKHGFNMQMVLDEKMLLNMIKHGGK